MQFNELLAKLKPANLRTMDRNTWLKVIAGVCVVVMVVVVAMTLMPSGSSVAQKSVDYINANLLQGQGTATLENVSSEGGVIKFTIKIGTQTYDSYATKDGKLFFPQAFKLNEPAENQGTPIQ